MPMTSVDARRDATRRDTPAAEAGVDHDLAADVIARMLDTADRARADIGAGQVGSLSLFLTDAVLLSRMLRSGWSLGDLAELAGRLWMVAP